MKTLLLICALGIVPAFAGSVTDAALGYSVTLPPNWVELKTKPLQHYFRDTTKQYKSQLSIVRYALDKTIYPTPESWTEAQFIGYKLSVEHSVFPFGTITYYDSSKTSQLGTQWSPVAFSMLYPGDGDPTYCEYIRYVALGDFGYEIYAIGDSTDMVNKVDFYAEILATTRLLPPTFIRLKKSVPRAAELSSPTPSVDGLGRRYPLSDYRRLRKNSVHSFPVIAPSP